MYCELEMTGEEVAVACSYVDVTTISFSQETQ
jgi:hypothetical protein